MGAVISLWPKANVRNVNFETLYSGQFTLSTQLIILNYPVILSYRRSTTVSLETYSFMRLLWRDLISLISSEKYFYRWPLWLVVRHNRQCCDQELWPLVFFISFSKFNRWPLWLGMRHTNVAFMSSHSSMYHFRSMTVRESNSAGEPCGWFASYQYCGQEL